jgi:hypothetical protein
MAPKEETLNYLAQRLQLKTARVQAASPNPIGPIHPLAEQKGKVRNAAAAKKVVGLLQYNSLTLHQSYKFVNSVRFQCIGLWGFRLRRANHAVYIVYKAYRRQSASFDLTT